MVGSEVFEFGTGIWWNDSWELFQAIIYNLYYAFGNQRICFHFTDFWASEVQTDFEDFAIVFIFLQKINKENELQKFPGYFLLEFTVIFVILKCLFLKYSK